MKIQNWGEDTFIEYLAKMFPTMNGDDCAVISPNLLVTTDALVEGVHFLKEQISPQDLGYKTIAVNVSDIVAMGGVPKYGFLSVAFPKTLEDSWIKHLMEGIQEACIKWNIFLLGGNTVGSKRDIFLSMTLVGSAEKIKYRNTAEEGDIICVSGNLGDSGAGFRALQEGVVNEKLIRSHFRPEPSVEQGKWLASLSGVHAMMDISDGLDCDLKRLLKASQKGAIIDIDKLPLSEELLKICREREWDPLQLALTGGEDYCLLFTVAKEATAPLFPIGTITKEGLIFQKGGKSISINYPHFDHTQVQ